MSHLCLSVLYRFRHFDLGWATVDPATPIKPGSPGAPSPPPLPAFSPAPSPRTRLIYPRLKHFSMSFELPRPLSTVCVVASSLAVFWTMNPLQASRPRIRCPLACAPPNHHHLRLRFHPLPSDCRWLSLTLRLAQIVYVENDPASGPAGRPKRAARFAFAHGTLGGHMLVRKRKRGCGVHSAEGNGNVERKGD